MTMYSNYLAEVGKLVYIIGEIETTSSFKKMLDSNNDTKSKFFFKCVDELPIGTYKKIKFECRRKGILRCDWFSKIMDKSPMMIFMVFNYCAPLDANQKWEDRLSITIRKINKVYDILRQTNKQDIILKVIIIISKEAVLQSKEKGNVIQIISQFLKNYEKELSIYQSDMLTKEVAKNKSHWFLQLEKAYERKYRAINKRKEDSFGERRLGCLIKMAIISEIISKKDSYTQYDQAYRSLHFRFMETMKNKVEFYNFDTIRELRTLADIVLLRRMIVKMMISSNFQNVPDTISYHLKYFYQVPQSQHYFFAYENIMWRENFLQNILEVIYSNDHIDVIPKQYFAQLINSAISLSYKLCRAPKEIEPILGSMEVRGRLIPTENALYIGSRNYAIGVDITDLDVIWTEMTELMQKKKDFVTRGLQTITRYKSMKLFKKHEVSFFNVYLLRFYLADEKFVSIGSIFNEIIKLKISEYDFYSLNYLIEELEKESENAFEHKILIHSLAVLIADYFKNKDEIERYGTLLMANLPNKGSNAKNIDLLGESTEQSAITEAQYQKDPLILPLPSDSLIFSLEFLFPDKLHKIQNELELEITPRFNNKFLTASGKKGKLKLFFNESKIEIEKEINFNNFQNQQKILIKVNPLLYFQKDTVLELKKAVLVMETNPQIHFLVQKIYYPKFRSVILITKLKFPEISITMPYDIYYFNQISKFVISMAPAQPSTKIEILFSVAEDPSNNTEVYTNLDQRLNIVNSNCLQPLSTSDANIAYLKCNKIGPKVLKFVFNVTITQHIGDKTLKDQHFISKEVGFRVVNLFRTMKMLKQAHTGADVKVFEIPINKGIIMSYHIKSVQTINVIELGQHKSPKPYFKTHKNISPLTDYVLTPDQKIKNVYIFEVVEEQLKNEDKKQLFLISFYIKWNRTDLDKKLGLPESIITNVYNEDDVKITLKNDKVEIEYEEGKPLKKRQKDTLSVKYRNLSSEHIHVYSTMDNSDEILRIGNRGSEVELGPKETKTIVFEVLPVKSGFLKYPYVRSYFDGIEAKDKVCTSIINVV